MKFEIRTEVGASLEQVWSCWTEPAHIIHWNFASDEWQCPDAKIDLTPGGSFSYRMEAKDGSMAFDFEGTFSVVETMNLIEYVLSDGRYVQIRFLETDAGIEVIEVFDAENEISGEQQRQGWQAILDNFKAYVERTGVS